LSLSASTTAFQSLISRSVLARGLTASGMVATFT
jgi:hypothetical protein